MKKGLFAIFVGTVGVLGIALYVIHSESPKKPIKQQTLESSSNTDDIYVEVIGGSKQHIGDIKKNERRKHTFIIKNISSTSTLKITSVKPSCGCLGANKASKNIISPGEESRIDVEIVGKTTVKRINGENYINIKFENHPTVLIAFSYSVIEDVFLSPEQIKRGAIYQKDKLSGNLLLRPLDWGPLKIKNWVSEKGIISLDKYEEINGTIRCYYLAKSLPPGKYHDTLTLRTNAKIDSEIKIPFSWEVEPNLTLRPKSIFWGTLMMGEKKKKNFQIKSVDDNYFYIKSLEYDKSVFNIVPLFDVNSSVKEAEYNITINPDKIASKKLFRDSLTIITNQGQLCLSMFGNAFQ